MKIALVGLQPDQNLGDVLLYRLVRSIISDYVKDASFIDIDLFGRDTKQNGSLSENSNNKTSGFKSFLISFLQKIPLVSNVFYDFAFKRFSKKHYKAFEQLVDCDRCVFVGGAIINKYLLNGIRLTVDICERSNIPVFFNAISFEIHKARGYHYQKFKKVLKSPSVYKVSTRDDDVYYGNLFDVKNKIVRVGDTALFTSDFFPSDSKDESIGINVIRPVIFKQYGFHIKEIDYEDFIIRAISYYSKFAKVVLYTNGDCLDNDFCVKVAQKTNTPFFIPKTCEELINTISSKKMIIASRLHSSIIACSYKIPCCSVVWNNKITSFYKQINNERNLLLSLSDGFSYNFDMDFSKLGDIKKTTIKQLVDFLDKPL